MFLQTKTASEAKQELTITAKQNDQLHTIVRKELEIHIGMMAFDVWRIVSNNSSCIKYNALLYVISA